MINLIGSDYSSEGFVNKFNLEQEAEKFFGEDWIDMGDDICVIETLIKHLGLDSEYKVTVNSDAEINIEYRE